MKFQLTLLVLIGLFLSSCNKYTRHWTGAKFQKAEKYHDLDGTEISEFLYGQRMAYCQNYAYIEIQENGEKHAYLHPNHKDFFVDQDFFQKFENSTHQKIDPTKNLNVIYIQSRSYKIRKHTLKKIKKTHPNQEIFVVLPSSLKLPSKTYPFPVIKDNDDIFKPLYKDKEKAMVRFKIRPNLRTNLSAATYGFGFFLPDSEYAELFTHGEHIIFQDEDKEISAEEYAQKKRTCLYQTVTYSKDGRDYASLVLRDRGGKVDITAFKKELESSLNTEVDLSRPLFILFFDQFKDLRSTLGFGDLIPQNFSKLKKHYPSFEYLLIKDIDLDISSSYLKNSTYRKTYTDRLGILDKYISLLELNVYNWIIVMPDGGCQIHYGKNADFIRMLESLRNRNE